MIKLEIVYIVLLSFFQRVIHKLFIYKFLEVRMCNIILLRTSNNSSEIQKLLAYVVHLYACHITHTAHKY